MTPGGTPGWEAVAVAVALVTAEHGGGGDSLEAIAGDVPLSEIVSALALLAGCFLRELRTAATDATMISHESAAKVLQAIGLRVLEEATATR